MNTKQQQQEEEQQKIASSAIPHEYTEILEKRVTKLSTYAIKEELAPDEYFHSSLERAYRVGVKDGFARSAQEFLDLINLCELDPIYVQKIEKRIEEEKIILQEVERQKREEAERVHREIEQLEAAKKVKAKKAEDEEFIQLNWRVVPYIARHTPNQKRVQHKDREEEKVLA